MNTCDLSRRTGLPVLAASVCALLLAAQSNAASLDPKLIPRQMTAAQIDAVRSIPDLQAIAVDKAAIPAHIRGDLGTFRSDAAVRDTDAAAFLEGMRKVLRAQGSESLKLRKSERDAARGMSHHRMTQTIDGLEVIGGEMILHVEDAMRRWRSCAKVTARLKLFNPTRESILNAQPIEQPHAMRPWRAPAGNGRTRLSNDLPDDASAIVPYQGRQPPPQERED